MVLNSLGIGAYAFQIEQQGSNLLISGFDLVPGFGLIWKENTE